MTGDYVYKNLGTHFRVIKCFEEINFHFVVIIKVTRLIP